MTRLLFAVIILASAGVADPPRAQTFSVSATDDRSLIRFRIRQLGIFWISGRFERFRGALTLHGADAVSSRVRIEIDAASINSKFPARDRYLRGEAVLASRHYPKITFESTRTEVTGPETALITGKMTFRAITRRVIIRVRYLVEKNQKAGDARKQFIGHASFRLSEFGVTGIPTLASDRVFLTIQLELKPT